ncbi:MAG: hypothetical protein ABI947_22065 [Chloroflexota bacterium]
MGGKVVKGVKALRFALEDEAWPTTMLQILGTWEPHTLGHREPIAAQRVGKPGEEAITVLPVSRRFSQQPIEMSPKPTGDNETWRGFKVGKHGINILRWLVYVGKESGQSEKIGFTAALEGGQSQTARRHTDKPAIVSFLVNGD